MEKFSEFCKKHCWALFFTALGLLLGILFMTIGFWRTMLLIVVVALCFLIGYLLDNGGVEGLKGFANKIFKGSTKE